MIYIVLEGDRIIGFPDASAAKPSGNGHVVHIVGRENDDILGNFPMRAVRYYGTTLPPVYKEKNDEQLRWASLTEEQRNAEREASRRKRDSNTGQALTVLTPTGDRPQAFALCEKWMGRQTWKGPIQWLCADDGVTPTEFTMNQEVVRRPPTPGKVTLAENLLAMIPLIKGEKVVIVEDDEWYNDIYLAVMYGLLESAELVGERDAKYYNVKSRRWFTPDNQRHASFCRTGFRKSLIPELTKACEASIKENDVFIDKRLWGQHGGFKPTDKLLLPWANLSVGIKGMPGRGGAGASHKWDAFQNRDGNLVQLKKWIGDSDAKEYEKFSDPRKVNA